MAAEKKYPGRARIWVGISGIAMILGGLFGIVRVLTKNFHQEAELLDISRTALIIGSVMVGQAILAKYRITVDEAYRLGFDVGHDKGFKEGRKAARPVVVDLKYPADEVTIRRHPE